MRANLCTCVSNVSEISAEICSLNLLIQAHKHSKHYKDVMVADFPGKKYDTGNCLLQTTFICL